MANRIVAINTGIKVVAIKDKNILSNKAIDIDQLVQCNHEEVETRMFLNAKHAATDNSWTITITSPDVVGVSLFTELNIKKLRIAFGKSKDFRGISVQGISLDPRARPLPFLHAPSL